MNAVIESLIPYVRQGERRGKPLVQRHRGFLGFWLVLCLMLVLVFGLAGCSTTPTQPEVCFPPIAPSGMAQPD